MADGDDDASGVRVWMVERTFSADSPHILVITYATVDGARSLTREWAHNPYTNRGGPTVTAAREASPADLVPVTDEALRERYRTEARRMRERHDPDDAV